MATAGDILVEARGIQKSFGGVHVLRGLDLTVRRHETRGHHRAVRQRQDDLPALPQLP